MANLEFRVQGFTSIESVHECVGAGTAYLTLWCLRFSMREYFSGGEVVSTCCVDELKDVSIHLGVTWAEKEV